MITVLDKMDYDTKMKELTVNTDIIIDPSAYVKDTFIMENVSKGYLFDKSNFDKYLHEVAETSNYLPYDQFVKKFFTDASVFLKSLGYNDELIANVFKTYVPSNFNEAKELCERYLSAEEEKESNRQRQLALDRTKDYTSDVQTFLKKRNVSVVHPRELADEFYNSLTQSEKEQYGGNPTYAVHCNQEDTRLDKALSSCVARFNHSKMVDKVISDYCAEHYPDEQNISMLIDKIAASCPSMLLSNDQRANAYQVIIRQQQQLEEAEKPDESAVHKAMSAFAAKYLNGEPMSVARDTCSKIKSVAKEATESFTKDSTSTVKDAVDTKVQEDPEWAKDLKTQIEQYQKTIAQMQEQHTKTIAEMNRHRDTQRMPRMDSQRMMYNDHRPYMRFPTWLIGVGVNLVLMLVVWLVGLLSEAPVSIGLVGLVIATIGYPMLGKHKDAKRFLIIGYGIFALWLLCAVLL